MSTCFEQACKLKAPQSWQTANMTKPESETLQAIDIEGEYKDLGGRPSDYSPEMGELICAKIASGKTLSEICRKQGMPARQTVLRWRREHSGFDTEYTRARVDQMENWGDDCVEIADDDTLDTLDSVDKQGNSIQVPNHANVQRDRLRIDTRKFMMSKIARHIYGERVEHEHSGEIHQRHTVELSDRERMRRLATFMLEDRAAGPVIEGELVDGVPVEMPVSIEPQPDNLQASSPDSQEPDVNQ